ncbi:hypothetical protein C8R46DRAFT_1069297 [Mycena filopes]|nr:hypothetical protein C8R46DRAFT_1069297 [Mycena filopes]
MAQDCPAELLIFIPIDETDLRLVIIPKSGLPHNHPTILPCKVPYTAVKTYRGVIDAVGLNGTTTLRVNKAASTKAALGGLLPEEVHPSLINNASVVRWSRTLDPNASRREWDSKRFGTSSKTRNPVRWVIDRVGYIHTVTMR